jgi:uncharacterized membrane protein
MTTSPIDSGQRARADSTLIARYFAGHTVMKGRQESPLRVWLLRLLLGTAGVVMVGVTVHDLIRKTGTLFVWPMPEGVPFPLALIGLALIAVALTPVLWQFGWQVLAASIVVTLLAEFAIFASDWRIRAVLIALALVALAFAIYSILAQKVSEPVDDTEQRVDAAIEAAVERLVAGSTLPLGPVSLAECRYVLRTFPKLDRTGEANVLCRVGKDGRPRVTPVGVGAFVFKSDTIAVVEGAIDLATQQAVYRRVHEFKYADVVSLLWTSDAVDVAPTIPSEPKAAGAAASPPPKRTASGREPAVRHRDSLEIRLTNGRAVSLVMSDSRFVPPKRRGASELPMLCDPVLVSRLWADILAGPGGGSSRLAS